MGNRTGCRSLPSDRLRSRRGLTARDEPSVALSLQEVVNSLERAINAAAGGGIAFDIDPCEAHADELASFGVEQAAATAAGDWLLAAPEFGGSDAEDRHRLAPAWPAHLIVAARDRPAGNGVVPRRDWCDVWYRAVVHPHEREIDDCVECNEPRLAADRRLCTARRRRVKHDRLGRAAVFEEMGAAEEITDAVGIVGVGWEGGDERGRTAVAWNADDGQVARRRRRLH